MFRGVSVAGRGGGALFSVADVRLPAVTLAGAVAFSTVGGPAGGAVSGDRGASSHNKKTTSKPSAPPAATMASSRPQTARNCVTAFFKRFPRYSATRLSRNALAMTETELRLMAAAAIIGLRSTPNTG